MQHIWPPWMVVTNGGVQFSTQFWWALLDLLVMQVWLSSVHHPETDGGMEQLNAVLEQCLCCFVNFQQDDWMVLFRIAEFTYNNTQYACKQMSPFLENYGYYPCLFPLTASNSLVLATSDFLQELKALHQVLKDKLDKANEDYKKFAD